MTGLPQSKIRFYEKHGLILSDRQENGYRVFTPEDAFKSNAFRVLLQYGFSIDEAVAMLDAKQGTEEFERSLLHQQEKLMHEADLIAYRLRRLESTLGAIQSEPGLEFELVDAADQVHQLFIRTRLPCLARARENDLAVLQPSEHHQLCTHHQARRPAGQPPNGQPRLCHDHARTRELPP